VKVAALVDESGATLVARCALADDPWTRMRGLLGRRGLDPDEGLLIRPTNAIHMLFMRFAIDAVFLDEELAVLRVVPELKPWRMAAERGAKAVLELPAGAAERAGIRPGMRLRVQT
jgi:uncharacterized membrane protein (UPF0127 family)